MKYVLPTVLIATLALLTPVPPTAAADSTGATPAPARTNPPTIYHTITTRLCAELHRHIAPTLGMMLENDRLIKNSPKLFSEYNRNALAGVDNSASNANTMNGVPMTGEASNSIMTDAQNMTLLKMENMVSPLANNIIAEKKLLDSPSLNATTGNPDDDKRLQDIREKLLKAIADQSASLDLINGFVQTQQMADLQHSGEEYISAMNQSDVSTTSKQAAAEGGEATPFPGMANPDVAGLPQDPYSVDLATIPGLTLGYNPTTRILDAVNWTIDQTQANESTASKAIMESAALCGMGDNPAPKASP